MSEIFIFSIAVVTKQISTIVAFNFWGLLVGFGIGLAAFRGDFVFSLGSSKYDFNIFHSVNYSFNHTDHSDLQLMEEQC